MKFDPQQVTLKNGVEIVIREAKRKDARQLLDTMTRCIMEGEFLITEIEEFNPTVQDQAGWIEMLNSSRNSLLLIATCKNEIIGSIDLKGETRKKIWHNATLGISILKKWQNLGLGKIMMQQALNWATNSSSLEQIWLNVFATHTIAINLYKSLGFKEVGIQKDFAKMPDGSFSNNIIMRKQVK